MSARKVRLEEICEINPRAQKSLKDELIASFLSMSAISEDGFIVEEEERTVGEVRKGYSFFERGDILVAKITPCFENGKAARTSFLRYPLGFGSTEFHVLRASEEVLTDYLFHMVWNSSFRKVGAENMTGSAGQKRVPTDFIRRLEIALPSLDKQQQIAAILDKAQQLRRSCKRKLQLVDRLMQSIFLEMFGCLSNMNTRWPTVQVAEAGRVQLGRQRAPKFQTGVFSRPYMRVANVYEDRIDLSDVLSMDFDECDFENYALKFGDILLNEGQSTELVGRPAMWRNEIEGCCFQNTLIRFQADRQKILPEFAFGVFQYYFRYGKFSEISSKTSSVAHLGASRFGRMPFPLPPINLQERFCAAANDTRTLKQRATFEMELADKLFASLQSLAVSGKL